MTLPPSLVAAVREARCESYYEEDGCDGPDGCEECCALVAAAVLRAALTGEGLGENGEKWRASRCYGGNGRTGEYYMALSEQEPWCLGPFDTEAEARAVANALNLLARLASENQP
jgi:hypothetical protein